MASMGKVLTMANLAMEIGGLLAQGRGDRGSPLLVLKYGLMVLMAVLTGLLGLTFLAIALVYYVWPAADVVTVFACLGAVFVVGCLGFALYLSSMKRPFGEDPKPVLPSNPTKLVDAFLRGMNG